MKWKRKSEKSTNKSENIPYRKKENEIEKKDQICVEFFFVKVEKNFLC